MDGRKIGVLVVEDEPLVMINVVAEREGNGLEVFEASNALEAIAILEKAPAVDVIFTDVDMPGGLDGLELARIVKDRYPLMQIIVTSGHRHVMQPDLPVEGVFFSKPYLSDKIVDAILALTKDRQMQLKAA